LALVSALLLTATAWWTWYDFEDARSDAEARLSAAALIVKGHAVRSFEAIDTALASVAELVEREGVEALRSEAQPQRLRQITRHLPATGEIFVVDENGDRVAASHPGPVVSVSDRGWFRQLKTGNEEIHIGRAQKGRGVHRIFFPVARALRRPDGAFAGAVQVGVDVSYLAALLKDLELGPGAAIGVFRARDGALIARHPLTEAMLNETTGPFFAVLGEAASWTGWLREGGEDRLLFVRRAERAPIIVCASVPKPEVYAAAWNRLPGRLSAVLAIWGALAALTVLAVRQARREASFRSLLSASDARFREMADHAPVMVWVSEPDGRCSFVSRSWYDFTGQHPDAALEFGWQCAVHDDDRPKLLEVAQAHADRREAFEVEYRLARRDGVFRWVLAVAAPRFDAHGGFLGYIGSVIDISGRKQAEAAVRDSEGRLRDALAAGHVMAFEWDATRRCSQRSANAAEILGHEAPKGAPTSSRTFLTRIHPDDRERFKSHVGGVTPDQPFYAVSFRYRRPDGREVWLEETARAEFDGAGRLVLVKGLTRDVTAQRQAEAHQKLLIAELDHRVKNALSRVAAVIRRTRQAGDSLDAFATTLDGRIQSMANAHELLSRSRWQEVRLADLVERELAPYAAAGNITLDGPQVMLTATATQTLAMVLHELTTNAAKYGALSVPSGRVSVRWATVPRPDGATDLALDWRESGGPPSASTVRPGYGTSVIRQLLPHQLGGAVDLAFTAGGVHCHIELPLALSPSVVAGDEPSGLLFDRQGQGEQRSDPGFPHRANRPAAEAAPSLWLGSSEERH
jgi:PAS domain S-box-containing protein